MSLSPATRLGPYEILARLGAGAMGEVYRARDTRLGREVAIKILPADLSGDPGRRARFEQEARALAALNHPHIRGLYDIGNDNDVSYIVTELVPGETLAALIQRGPLPIKRLIEIAVQIADGMAAAHAARISHRDLKPANIMFSSDGRVKILDCGLSKQAPAPAAEPDATLPLSQTQPGIMSIAIVGGEAWGRCIHPWSRRDRAHSGKSFAFGSIKPRSSLWMLEGFAVKSGLLARQGL